jgi:hypothetical protein
MSGLMMANSAQKSNPMIWVALLLTIALVLWVNIQSDDASQTDIVDLVNQKPIKAKPLNQAENRQKKTVDAEDRRMNTKPTATVKGIIDWDQLDRSTQSEKSAGLFKPHSWVVEPPKAKEVKLPPPPPTAPPVPFTYMGRLDNGPQGNLIYLASNDKSYSVLIGQKVNGFWQLEREDSNNLYFTYLPLNLPQVLSKNQTSATFGAFPAPVNAF